MRLPLALLVIGACAAASVAPPANAVVVAGGTGSSNPSTYESAPADNPYWANVGWGAFGTSSGAAGSAIYIGSGYVLTASHTYGGQIILGTDDPSGGTTYSQLSGGFNQNLLNADNSPSELRLFQVAGDPGLPAVPIFDQPLTSGTALMLIGTGRERGSELKTYDFTGTPAADASGYDWASTRDKAWGLNNVTNANQFYDNIAGLNDFHGFSARFDENLAGEAMATDKDSGSAVFAYDVIDNRWELAGITTALTTYVDQPANTSLFGQSFIAIDLTDYADQIATIVPEPSTALLLVGMAFGLVRQRPRRS